MIFHTTQLSDLVWGEKKDIGKVCGIPLGVIIVLRLIVLHFTMSLPIKLCLNAKTVLPP